MLHPTTRPYAVAIRSATSACSKHFPCLDLWQRSWLCLTYVIFSELRFFIQLTCTPLVSPESYCCSPHPPDLDNTVTLESHIVLQEQNLKGQREGCQKSPLGLDCLFIKGLKLYVFSLSSIEIFHAGILTGLWDKNICYRTLCFCSFIGTDFHKAIWIDFFHEF